MIATRFIEPWILFPGNAIIVLILMSVISGVARAAVVRALSPTQRYVVRFPLGWLRAVSLIAAASAIVLLVASTPATARRFLSRLEREVPAATPEALQRAEAVVVLGGGVITNSPASATLAALGISDAEQMQSPRASERTPPPATLAALTPEAESRLVHGVRLARLLRVPLVVSGGRVLADASVPAEAEVAAVVAADLGVPPEMIIPESESRTTWENAQRVRALLDAGTPVVLVTSAWHMPRARDAFLRVGLAPLPAPGPYWSDARALTPVMFMPSAATLYQSAVVARETVGRIWYGLQTTAQR